MAGENFCAESLERRRRDVSVQQQMINAALRSAEAAAEKADVDGVNKHLDQAQARITSLRNDLEDLAMERERQMDAEDGLCGR